MKIIELAGTCDAAGDLTLTATELEYGFLEKIEMVYDDGDTGADSVFTSEGAVSEPIMTKANLGIADVTFYPRTPSNAVADGTAFTNWADKLYITGKPKVVISNGGVSKNFRFLVYLSDE